MKRLAPATTDALRRRSPIGWTSTGDEPAFEFAVDARGGDFIGFFLRCGRAPRLAFDQGSGFNDITAMTLKAFPFAFYHVSLARTRGLERVRFTPSDRPSHFQFVAFQTKNAILIAVLHYLFNLRYQNIGLVAPDAKDPVSRWQRVRANVARIVKFFRDVSKGGGVRIQEGSAEMLPILKLAMSMKAIDVQHRMATELAGAAAPLLSFVCPTYNTRADYLRDLVDSFAVQQAPYAELILTDDGSPDPETRPHLERAATQPGVRIVFNAVNRGIAAATNAGIASARGQWLAFIDHDDAFVPGAIAIMADAIAKHPGAIFFYTDEVIVDDALKPIGSFCKPAYDSVLLSGMNYINHFSIFRRDKVEAIGRLREDREGSQDYDLVLRYLAGAAAGTIVHIPFPAYMWRRAETTYSTVNLTRSVESARRALSAAYGAVTVAPARDPNLHRVRFATATPKISVVIPNRESLPLIERIVRDLTERTDYPDLEIVIVDNGSTSARVLAFYDRLSQRPNVKIEVAAAAFNFARMCNRGAALASGGLVLFLNNDIEVVDPLWLREMVECLAFPQTGIVGARLLYASGKVQHNGVIVGLGGAAGHWYVEAEPDDPGPMGRFNVRQTQTAVTAACMLVTRSCFDALGGFDEEAFAVAYNDIDFCVRARKAGIRTVWTPFATLTHHESLTRGSDETGSAADRFREEFARLQERHGTADFIDEAFSPFYDRRESRPFIIVPEDLPAGRPNALL